MDRTKRFVWISLVVCLASAAVGRLARADVIAAGYDLLETDSGATLDDLQLPAMFFGPGSLPFEGRVYLKGVPFATFDPDGPGPALNGSAIARPEDDLDALEMSDAGDLIFGVDLVNNATGVGPPDGIPDRHVFFSIDTASPSNAIPGVDPDDVLVTPPGGFAFGVFADGTTTIGLLPGDDIDGLALSDVPPFGVLNPGLDQALFSLHPGSPSVLVGPDGVPGTGDEVSAADVFVTSFTGTHALYASAGALGLLPSDNVNALDIWPRDLSAPGGGGGGGAKKKLSQEDEERAKHGIRVSQKRRCNMSTTATFNVTIFALGEPFTVNLQGPSSGMRGATEFNPGTGQTKIPIELLSMTLSGNSPFGLVVVRAGREQHLKPSPGVLVQRKYGAFFLLGSVVQGPGDEPGCP